MQQQSTIPVTVSNLVSHASLPLSCSTVPPRSPRCSSQAAAWRACRLSPPWPARSSPPSLSSLATSSPRKPAPSTWSCNKVTCAPLGSFPNSSVYSLFIMVCTVPCQARWPRTRTCPVARPSPPRLTWPSQRCSRTTNKVTTQKYFITVKQSNVTKEYLFHSPNFQLLNFWYYIPWTTLDVNAFWDITLLDCLLTNLLIFQGFSVNSQESLNCFLFYFRNLARLLLLQVESDLTA